MQSMTGFGQFSTTIDDVIIEVNMKSVNGRYLDIRPHLPKKYFLYEGEITKLIKSSLQRGTVDIYVQRVTKAEDADVEFQFKTSLAKRWITELRASLKKLKIEDNLTTQDVLSIPEFVQIVESNKIKDKEKAVLLKAVKQTVNACQAEREREGQFLKKTCQDFLQKLLLQLKTLNELRAEFTQNAQTKVATKMQKILEGFEADPTRIMQEAALLVDKTDIEEELFRLQEHIKNVTTLLGSAEANGKKLDFYAQELLREINTIGSKSQSARITESVVNCKNIVEQLREQIQNIE